MFSSLYIGNKIFLQWTCVHDIQLPANEELNLEELLESSQNNPVPSTRTLGADGAINNTNPVSNDERRAATGRGRVTVLDGRSSGTSGISDPVISTTTTSSGRTIIAIELMTQNENRAATRYEYNFC